MGEKGRQTYREILESKRNEVREATKQGAFSKDHLKTLEKRWKEYDWENRKMN